MLELSLQTGWAAGGPATDLCAALGQPESNAAPVAATEVDADLFALLFAREVTEATEGPGGPERTELAEEETDAADGPELSADAVVFPAFVEPPKPIDPIREPLTSALEQPDLVDEPKRADLPRDGKVARLLRAIEFDVTRDEPEPVLPEAASASREDADPLIALPSLRTLKSAITVVNVAPHNTPAADVPSPIASFANIPIPFSLAGAIRERMPLPVFAIPSVMTRLDERASDHHALPPLTLLPRTQTTLSTTFDIPATPASSVPTEVESRIVDAIRLAFGRTGGEAHIKLNPRQFGDVSVSIRVERQTVVAVVHADAPAVREWLQANQQVLRESLSIQGLQLHRLEVVATEESAESNANESSERRNNGEESRPRRQRAKSGQMFEVDA